MKSTTLRWMSLCSVPYGVLWWNMPLTGTLLCRTMKIEPLIEASRFPQETCIWAFGASFLPQPSLNSPEPICFHYYSQKHLVVKELKKQWLDLSAWLSVYLAIAKGLEGF